MRPMTCAPHVVGLSPSLWSPACLAALAPPWKWPLGWLDSLWPPFWMHNTTGEYLAPSVVGLDLAPLEVALKPVSLHLSHGPRTWEGGGGGSWEPAPSLFQPRDPVVASFLTTRVGAGWVDKLSPTIFPPLQHSNSVLPTSPNQSKSTDNITFLKKPLVPGSWPKQAILARANLPPGGVGGGALVHEYTPILIVCSLFVCLFLPCLFFSLVVFP